MKYAVLPAAGKSTRMGQSKLALPLGERTVLEQVIAALRRAEVERIVVIVGPHVRELTALAQNAGAEVCQLDDETADMRTTVEQGLRWLEDRYQPRPDDTWLLVPADHPTLNPLVVRQLDRARRAHPERSIFVPIFQGRRGHPLLLSWRHVEGIRGSAADQGVNAYVRRQAAETLEVPVETETILCDLDTPEDYERLRREEANRTNTALPDPLAQGPSPT